MSLSQMTGKCLPLHGAELNGFWVAIASEVVILVHDPFKQPSLLGWQDLE